MAQITRYDSVGDPGVTLVSDDVADTMTLATTDDVGGAGATIIFSDSTAQQAVDLVRGPKAGTVALDGAGGLVWAIAKDGSSMFTVQKADAIPQQVALSSAETGIITGWLVALMPNVHRGR